LWIPSGARPARLRARRHGRCRAPWRTGTPPALRRSGHGEGGPSSGHSPGHFRRVVFGAAKSPDQVTTIARRVAARGPHAIATHVDQGRRTGDRSWRSRTPLPSVPLGYWLSIARRWTGMPRGLRGKKCRHFRSRSGGGSIDHGRDRWNVDRCVMWVSPGPLSARRALPVLRRARVIIAVAGMDGRCPVSWGVSCRSIAVP